MAKEKKEDEYKKTVASSSFCAYIKADENDKEIGVWAKDGEYLKAEKSHALRSLKRKFGFRIQMVIP